MKRLLCIVSSLDVGGAETFLMKIFRALPKEYKLDFVVSKETGYYEDEVISLGGRIHRIPLRTKKPLKAFNDLRRIVRENKYDTVLKLSDTPIAYFDMLACKMGGAKTLIVRSCNAHSGTGKIRAILNNILRQKLNTIADVKIAPSDLAAEYTFGKEEIEKGNVHFLNNALDIDMYRFSEDARNKIRAEFGIAQNQLLVGHIGRFNYQKNHPFLLEVFSQLKNKMPDAVLILVGNGEREQEVKSRAEDLRIEKNVIFAGIRDDIPDILSAMDLIVFPSFYEGMPNVIIEAQATGLQCFISDRITKSANVTGLVHYIPLEYNAEAWADIILELYKNVHRAEYSKIVGNAGYDISVIVKEFIRLSFRG